MNLIEYLQNQNPQNSKSSLKEMLAKGRVLVNGKVEKAYNYQVKEGDKVEFGQKSKINKPQHQDFDGMMSILHEDKDIIVIYKKEGLLSIGTDADKENTAYHKLNMYVKSKGYNRHIYVVHRLDCKTSGVMMFAKSEQARDILRSRWKELVSDRRYYALVEGAPKQDEGTIESFLSEDKMLKMYSSDFDNGGKKAVTNYRVVQRGKNYSLLELKLDTGRKNQIRVHLQQLGCPIAGDSKYGAQTDPLNRLCLHAKNLEFVHPITGKEMKFEYPYPNGFNKCVYL